MRWCEKEIEPGSLDEQDCQVAYFNTFLATERGKEVLCDLMNAAGMFGIVPPEHAEEYRVASNFIKSILSKCGLSNPQAMIDAYAEIAKNWRQVVAPPEQDVFDTDKNLL